MAPPSSTSNSVVAVRPAPRDHGSMARGYGQYCPLALAAETLGERWTILVVSRLLDGCTSFNAIHRGIPRISPSLLAKRLAELQKAGLVEKKVGPGDSRPVYALTAAGRDLGPIVDQLAIWGQSWGRDLTHEDLDPAFLAWSMSLRMNRDALPEGRVVLEFEFTNTPGDLSRFWLVCENGVPDMCLQHPGFEPDLCVRADIRVFVDAWRGFRDLRSELRAGRIRLSGPAHLRRQFPDWLLLSALSPYPRKRPGRERRLSERRPDPVPAVGR